MKRLLMNLFQGQFAPLHYASVLCISEQKYIYNLTLTDGSCVVSEFLRQKFLGVLLGGGGASVVFFPEGKCYQTVNGSKKYLRKNQELTFIERTNMHTMPNL